MPCTSAVRATSSTEITPASADASSLPAVSAPSKRNRFEVFLASRTLVPGGSARYRATRSATAASCRVGVKVMYATLVRFPRPAQPSDLHRLSQRPDHPGVGDPATPR